MFKITTAILTSLILLTGCSADVSDETPTQEKVVSENPIPNEVTPSSDSEYNEETEVELEDNSGSDTGNGSQSTNPATAKYSFAEVSKHNNEKDCWVIVNKKVHNLTTWIFGHPGGRDAIIGICGTDATELFLYQHGGSAQPEFILSRSQIGILSE